MAVIYFSGRPPENPGPPADVTRADIHNAFGTHGKVNAFRLVETLENFHTDKNGCKYYKGKRLCNLADYIPAMRDLNRMRIAQGEIQITYNPEWGV